LPFPGLEKREALTRKWSKSASGMIFGVATESRYVEIIGSNGESLLFWQICGAFSSNGSQIQIKIILYSTASKPDHDEIEGSDP